MSKEEEKELAVISRVFATPANPDGSRRRLNVGDDGPIEAVVTDMAEQFIDWWREQDPKPPWDTVRFDLTAIEWDWVERGDME